MRGLLKVVYAEIRGLHQSAYILAVFAIGSQALALVRDRLFAHSFGAGRELDLYYAAFRVPDLLFVLFASILSVYVLIPFISERVEGGDTKGAQDMLSSVLSVFIGAYVLIALAVGYFASTITYFIFPGFSGEEQATIVVLLRVLLIQPLLLGISSLFGVVTQLRHRFVLFAVSPLLYNGGIIFGVVVLYPLFGIQGIVWGVVLGALLHGAIQLPLVWHASYMPRLMLFPNMRLVGKVLLSSLPRALTLSMNQIVLVAYVGIASSMAIGSVSIFQFALNLQSVPLSIIGVSYSVAAFPILAQLYSRGEHREFVLRVEVALRHMISWLLPAVVLIIVVRAQIVRVILGSGAFDWNDTRLTAACLALFSLSLVAQSVNLLVVRAFYAGGNTRTPFIVTMVTTVCTLALSLVLYAVFLTVPAFATFVERLFRVEGVKGTEIMMLPLAYSSLQLIHTAYLLGVFVRRFKVPRRQLFHTCVRASISAIGGGCISYIVLNTFVAGIRTETFVGIFLQGAVAGIAGIVTVVLLLFLMKSPELKELWITIRRTSFFSRVLGPDEMDTLVQ